MNFHTNSPLNMIFYQFNRIGCCSCCYIKTYSRFETWIDAMKNFIKIVIIWFQHRWNSNKLWILLHSYTYMHNDVSVITFINRIYNGISNLIIAEYQFFIGFNAIFLPWISPSFPTKYPFNLSNLLNSLRWIPKHKNGAWKMFSCNSRNVENYIFNKHMKRDLIYR